MTKIPLELGVGKGKMVRLTRLPTLLSKRYSSPLRGLMRKLSSPNKRAMLSANRPAALIIILV